MCHPIIKDVVRNGEIPEGNPKYIKSKLYRGTPGYD
jgi:hypothetical protein